jgi:Mn-dependent DtxR family transcriptional regulator
MPRNRAICQMTPRVYDALDLVREHRPGRVFNTMPERSVGGDVFSALGFLGRLRAAGWVVKDRHGYWTLTDAGLGAMRDYAE